MPTPISHAAVGFAVGTWAQPGIPRRRVCLVAAACAAFPDIDVLAWPLHLSSSSPLGHRAITHSLVFALAGAVVATLLCFRGPQWTNGRARIAAVLALALLSHACLDALSTYSAGVEFLAPFSDQRFRFLWTPLGDPTGGLIAQLVQDCVFVFLPAILIGWLGIKIRGRRSRRAVIHPPPTGTRL
jgi:inner membrane protein